MERREKQQVKFLCFGGLRGHERVCAPFLLNELWLGLDSFADGCLECCPPEVQTVRLSSACSGPGGSREGVGQAPQALSAGREPEGCCSSVLPVSWPAGRALQSSQSPVQEWLRGLRTVGLDWSGLAWSLVLLVAPGRPSIGAARPDGHCGLLALAELS